MEKIAEIDTTEIAATIEPTLGAFIPLLEEKRSEIQEIPRKTFKYGPTDRHQLDVYYPIVPDASGQTKVLIWVYGGGFASGDRQLPAPADLGYVNIGAYFARQGFIVIIPDYRLVPDALFPGAAEDVRDSVLWAIKNPEHLTSPNSPNPDIKGIFLMGHSAGAVHAFSALVIPETNESLVLLPSIAGLISCGGAHHFEAIEPGHWVMETINQLWGGAEGIRQKAPIGLLRSASNATVAALPRTVLVVAEREPDFIHKSNDDFQEALEARTGKKVVKIVAQGHNHLSINWALGTGQGEVWAEETIAWIKG